MDSLGEINRKGKRAGARLCKTFEISKWFQAKSPQISQKKKKKREGAFAQSAHIFSSLPERNSFLINELNY